MNIQNFKGETNQIVISPKQNYIAFSQFKFLYLYSLKSHKLITQLLFHNYYISYITFSQDDRYIGSVSLGCQIYIWDIKKHKLIEVKKTINRIHKLQISSQNNLSFFLDIRGNFSINRDYNYNVFNIKGSHWDDERIKQFSYHKNNNFIALAKRNATIVFLKNYQIADQIPTHRYIRNLNFNNQGTVLAWICLNLQIHTYNTSSGIRNQINLTTTYDLMFINNEIIMGMIKNSEHEIALIKINASTDIIEKQIYKFQKVNFINRGKLINRGKKLGFLLKQSYKDSIVLKEISQLQNVQLFIDSNNNHP